MKMASIRACDLDEANLDLDGREILNRAKRLPDGAHEPNYNTPRSVLGRVCPGRPRTDHVSNDLRQELSPTDCAVALDVTCPVP